MEKTYKHTITTLDGEDKEITLHRLTMRHGLKLQGMNEGDILEYILDTCAPGVLDEISPASFGELTTVFMETEKGFFDQLASMLAPVVPKPSKTKKAKKSK